MIQGTVMNTIEYDFKIIDKESFKKLHKFSDDIHPTIVINGETYKCLCIEDNEKVFKYVLCPIELYNKMYEFLYTYQKEECKIDKFEYLMAGNEIVYGTSFTGANNLYEIVVLETYRAVYETKLVEYVAMPQEGYRLLENRIYARLKELGQDFKVVFRFLPLAEPFHKLDTEYKEGEIFLQ